MQQPNRALVLGGNGFVGQHVLALMAHNGWQLSAVSRSGEKPAHLHGDDYAWAEAVEWISADGRKLSEQDIDGYDALICLVGAPPIPTLTQAAIETQRALNAAANVNVIRQAKGTSIARLALVGAHIPSAVRHLIAGYFLGKRDCYRAARDFAAIPGKSACVLQPPLIVGERFTRKGTRIPLGKITSPLKALPLMTVVQVETIARQIVEFVEQDSGSGQATDGCQVLGPKQLSELERQ